MVVSPPVEPGQKTVTIPARNPESLTCACTRGCDVVDVGVAGRVDVQLACDDHQSGSIQSCDRC